VLTHQDHLPCSAGLGGGGAKALAGTIVMRNVSVVRNSAADGGAFEVAKQEGSNLFPTVLLVSVSFLQNCDPAGHLHHASAGCLQCVVVLGRQCWWSK
jgi:hypothetical protein